MEQYAGIEKPKNGKVKTSLAYAVVFLVMGLLIFVPSVTATPFTPEISSPVLMIDGTGDGDALVSILIADITSNFEFGYLNSEFHSILSGGLKYVTFDGGDIVDFAIKSGEAIYSLSDGDSKMTFFGDIPAGPAEKPLVDFDYWKAIIINWTIGGFDFMINLCGETDGFAPTGVSVPDAGIMWLLGPAFIALGILGRKKSREHV